MVLLSASVVSYLAFVLALSVPHLSCCWRPGGVILRDCGTSWISSHILLPVVHLSLSTKSSYNSNSNRPCRNNFSSQN